MSVMIDKTPTQKYNHGMILTYSDIVKKESSIRKARKAIFEKKYLKIGHGLYCQGTIDYDSLEVIFSRYKNIIVTLNTAFEIYDMVDRNSDKYTIATVEWSRVITSINVDQIFTSKKYFSIGKTKMLYQGFYIYIYDKERLLIELIRNKHRFPYDYYKEVVNSYRKLFINHELDINKLRKYLKHFTYGNSILSRIMEVIV